MQNKEFFQMNFEHNCLEKGQIVLMEQKQLYAKKNNLKMFFDPSDNSTLYFNFLKNSLLNTFV